MRSNPRLRQALLDTAIRHFVRDGYPDTNLQAIAEDAGVTRGPLYYYFKNKAALYTKAVAFAIEEQRENYTRILDAEMPLFEVLRADVRYCLSPEARLALLVRAGASATAPDVSALVDEFGEWLYEKKLSVMNAAKARGELRADCDVSTLNTFLYTYCNGISALKAKGNHLASALDPAVMDRPEDLFLELVQLKFFR